MKLDVPTFYADIYSSFNSHWRTFRLPFHWGYLRKYFNKVPQIVHFNVVLLCTLFCGVWPLRHIKTEFSHIYYYIYSWLTFIISGIFTLAHYIALFICVTKEFDLKVLTNIITSATVYSIGLVKVWYIWKENCMELIRDVEAKEKQIYTSKDNDIISIYDRNVKDSNKVIYFYWISQCLDSALYLYIIVPVFVPKEIYVNPLTNETVQQQPLPLRPWFPFDTHKHHMAAFLWEEFACSVCLLLSYGSDIFLYSSLAYILGQFNILKHIFINFETYKSRIKDQLNCTKDKADLVTLQLCIAQHQRILWFIHTFNDTMKTVMLLDFLQSSTQLAMLAIFLMNETSAIALVISGGYIVIMVGRLAIYYWYGSEIAAESYNVLKVVYGTKWYEKSQKMRTMWALLIMRCNNEEGIKIGGLTTMSWSIFIKVVKGAYSFVTFVVQK